MLLRRKRRKKAMLLDLNLEVEVRKRGEEEPPKEKRPDGRAGRAGWDSGGQL